MRGGVDEGISGASKKVMSGGVREQMTVNIHNKINDYLYVLEKQVCFANDCIDALKKMDAAIQKMNESVEKDLGDDELIEEALSDDDRIIHVSYASTAYLALHNEVIITVAKILEDTARYESISIRRLRDLLDKNSDIITEKYQKECYSDYCKKYNITKLVRQFHPDVAFRLSSELIEQFDRAWDETSDARNKIKQQRDQIYAHYDEQWRNDQKLNELRKKCPLNYGEVEELLRIAHDFLRHISMTIGRAPMSDRMLV